MRVDLHIHTTASDGCWSPEQLVRKVAERGIGLFAVTDHESVANVAETRKLAETKGLGFLPGVEISATSNGQMYHILGYYVDVQNKDFLSLLGHNSELMRKKDDESIVMLAEKGYPLDLAKYQTYQNDPRRGGWKALNFLIDEGICADKDDFFRNLFKGDLKTPFPIFPEPFEVIEVIKESGGIPVLAHPGGDIYGGIDLLDTLEFLYSCGIEGIECFHPEHDSRTTKFCLGWTKEKNLHISGGSDCHGELHDSRRLGEPFITEKEISSIWREKGLFQKAATKTQIS